MGEGALLLLGAGTMQIPAMEAAKRIGLTLWVVDANPEAPGVPLADHFEAIDLRDPESIIRLARSIPHLRAVFTAGTDFSLSVARVAEALGLPGVPREVALDASRKSSMRRRFAEAGVSSPAFAVIRGGGPLEEQVSRAVASVGVPAVAKPADNMGARGVRRVARADEAMEAVESAMAWARGGEVVYEEWIEGREFSIDALVYRGEITITGIADRHIYFDPYFIEMGHTIPALLEREEEELLLETFRAGVRALGIDNGAAKGDVFIREEGGAVVGEIAARLSGGYMSGWTYPLATGVELTEAGIRLALGEDPRTLLIPKRHHTTAERAFISIPGTLREIEGADALTARTSVRELFLRVAPADALAPPRNNTEKCGNLIVTGVTRLEACREAAEALRSLTVRLEPSRGETDSYLFSRRGEVSWYHYPELLPLPVPAARLREKELRAWARRCRNSGLLLLDPAVVEAAPRARVDRRDRQLGAGHHWSGFTREEAVQSLLSRGVAAVESLEESAVSLLLRVLAIGGNQGLLYIRDTLMKKGEAAVERWIEEMRG